MFRNLIIILISILFLVNHSNAKMEKEEKNFLNTVFDNNVPKKKRVILKGQAKQDIKRIMGDNYKKVIFSYWEKDDKTIWILNSIGKYKPITTGFIVSGCELDSAYVLVYREQHGYEIKYPSFLSQFPKKTLKTGNKLNEELDNISGATLSVRSMDRMARTALLLTNLTNENTCT